MAMDNDPDSPHMTKRIKKVPTPAMDFKEQHPHGMGQEYSLAPFFELSADLLCIAGFDGYFKMTSPSVSKTLGYSEEELLARPINSFIHPQDREITARHRTKILQGKPLLNFENRYLTKDGVIVWLSWTSMPLHEKRSGVCHRQEHHA